MTSPDNVVVLVGVSGGNLWLLVVGLALATPLLVWGHHLERADGPLRLAGVRGSRDVLRVLRGRGPGG